MILFDTDVAVDVIRSHPPAVAWLQQMGSTALGLPGIVAMEIYCTRAGMSPWEASGGVYPRRVERTAGIKPAARQALMRLCRGTVQGGFAPKSYVES